jgi:hypothetical protein
MSQLICALCTCTVYLASFYLHNTVKYIRQSSLIFFDFHVLLSPIQNQSKSFCYSGRDASLPKFFFFIHRHRSCRFSGDCEGSWDRTRNCALQSGLVHAPNGLNQLRYHLPKIIFYDEITKVFLFQLFAAQMNF